MISSISSVGFSSNFRELGNASQDYLSLALVIQVSKAMEIAIQEFINSYDPKKMYRGIEGISTKTIGLNLNVKV